MKCGTGRHGALPQFDAEAAYSAGCHAAAASYERLQSAPAGIGDKRKSGWDEEPDEWK
jgi:hypothetical protein